MIHQSPIYIGVDPAFRKGGFWAAILDMTDKTLVFREFDLLSWHDWLRSDDAPDMCFVCVENSNLQNENFDISTKAVTLKNKLKEVARKGRNVGCNQSVSQLAYESAVLRYGAKQVFGISPKDKGAKITDTRMFLGLMKQEGILLPPGATKQDQRDAAKLALICQRRALMEGRFAAGTAKNIHYNPAP